MAGAIQMRMEDKIGSLEKSKYADLIILDKDVFAVPPNELSSIKVLLTMMNGRITNLIQNVGLDVKYNEPKKIGAL